ncbi:MAG TPA: ribosome small subunit-dependent GTPase A [Candidatus Limnocylindria bacterium]|nr:ribosome small subunit-dependent GTPase A [Candidatus Limnocylindria bacterium]
MASAAPPPHLLRGTILRARSGFYTVLTDGGTFQCRLRGRVTRDRLTADPAVIGDRVAITAAQDGTGMIESVEDRHSRFSRRQPGPRGTWREDVMVANLDQVLVVFACADPIPHLRMVDRFLVVAEHNQIEAVLVVNKVDLCGAGVAREEFATYERIGYPVHYVSARFGDGVEAIAVRLAGRISVVTGPSGVGKSTLLNDIQPGLHLLTGAVGEVVHKGRHTTTAAELHPLTGPAGGWVADTPGVRELGLWAVPADELAWCFPEMRTHLGACGFNDCRHLDEPRCAVRAAVASGEVSEARYDSYLRLEAGD